MKPQYEETDPNRPNDKAGKPVRPGPSRSDNYDDEPKPRADEDDIAPEDVEPRNDNKPVQPPSGHT